MLELDENRTFPVPLGDPSSTYRTAPFPSLVGLSTDPSLWETPSFPPPTPVTQPGLSTNMMSVKLS